MRHDEVIHIEARHSKPNKPSWFKLTALDQYEIHLELNDFKENEMVVHPKSKENNQYYKYDPEIEAGIRKLKLLNSKQLKYPFFKFGSGRTKPLKPNFALFRINQ